MFLKKFNKCKVGECFNRIICGSQSTQCCCLLHLHSRSSESKSMSTASTPKKIEKLLYKTVGEVTPPGIGKKVTVVGIGAVGMACAFSILTQGVTRDIALVDVEPNKLRGEMLDLQHGSFFLKGIHVSASTDYEATKDSSICIITAGVRQVGSQTRLQVLNENMTMIKGIVPNLVKHSPNTIIIMVTNPVDVLTYHTWKLSGLPVHKVIGSGTNLDTSRFRFLLSQHLGVNANNCHAWIIGEHGDSSVPLWSTVNIAGTRLTEIVPESMSGKEETFMREIHAKVLKSGVEVRTLKGSTSWAVGLSVANICEHILKNDKRIAAVSTLVKGIYGVDDEVFLSVPCMLGLEGIVNIVYQSITEEEKLLFRKSAHIISEASKGVKM